MISLTRKEKRSIIKCIFMLVIFFVIIKLYNENYYKIDMKTISENSLLKYKNMETDNSFVTTDFMKLVSDGDYQSAFELLDVSNRNNMFSNSVEIFKEKLMSFKGMYSNLQYNTMFSKEFENYIDEEIICTICDSSGNSLHSIRFSIRTYKINKLPKVIILNID